MKSLPAIIVRRFIQQWFISNLEIAKRCTLLQLITGFDYNEILPGSHNRLYGLGIF
jgi:hypothetical protein